MARDSEQVNRDYRTFFSQTQLKKDHGDNLSSGN
jgi:hypothetical protein